jgi:hypothetical protein
MPSGGWRSPCTRESNGGSGKAPARCVAPVSVFSCLRWPVWVQQHDGVGSCTIEALSVSVSLGSSINVGSPRMFRYLPSGG